MGFGGASFAGSGYNEEEEEEEIILEEEDLEIDPQAPVEEIIAQGEASMQGAPVEPQEEYVAEDNVNAFREAQAEAVAGGEALQPEIEEMPEQVYDEAGMRGEALDIRESANTQNPTEGDIEERAGNMMEALQRNGELNVANAAGQALDPQVPNEAAPGPREPIQAPPVDQVMPNLMPESMQRAPGLNIAQAATPPTPTAPQDIRDPGIIPGQAPQQGSLRGEGLVPGMPQAPQVLPNQPQAPEQPNPGMWDVVKNAVQQAPEQMGKIFDPNSLNRLMRGSEPGRREERNRILGKVGIEPEQAPSLGVMPTGPKGIMGKIGQRMSSMFGRTPKTPGAPPPPATGIPAAPPAAVPPPAATTTAGLVKTGLKIGAAGVAADSLMPVIGDVGVMLGLKDGIPNDPISMKDSLRFLLTPEGHTAEVVPVETQKEIEEFLQERMSNGKMKEFESKAFMQYATGFEADLKMRAVENFMDPQTFEAFSKLVGVGDLLPGTKDIVNTNVLRNLSLDPNSQRYLQASKTFSDDFLRLKSGAQTSEAEFGRLEPIPTVKPGDSREVVRQKQETRQNMLNASELRAGVDNVRAFRNKRILQIPAVTKFIEANQGRIGIEGKTVFTLPKDYNGIPAGTRVKVKDLRDVLTIMGPAQNPADQQPEGDVAPKLDRREQLRNKLRGR